MMLWDDHSLSWAVLWFVVCLTASLASTHQEPLPPAVTTRCLKILNASPGGTVAQLRTSGLPALQHLLCQIAR